MLMKKVKPQRVSWEISGQWSDLEVFRTICYTKSLTEVGLSFDLEQQGVYGLVSNLGSLIARLLFQPVEESCFAEFSFLFISGD